MGYVVPNVYRRRIAENIAGVPNPPDIVPAYAKLGSGRYDPNTGQLIDPTPNDTDVESPIPGYTNIPLTVSVSGNSAVIVLSVPGGSAAVDVSEIGIFTADDVPVVLDCFRPVTLQAPLTLQVTYTIYPEV